MKRKPTPGTVLVIKGVHQPQQGTYTYEPAEVSEATAAEQLSLDKKDRNFHWRNVRYATDEEFTEYYGMTKEAAYALEIEPQIAEVETQENSPSKPRGRKPKEVKEE